MAEQPQQPLIRLKMKRLTVVCAWCEQVITQGQEEICFSICPGCQSAVEQEQGGREE